MPLRIALCFLLMLALPPLLGSRPAFIAQAHRNANLMESPVIVVTPSPRAPVAALDKDPADPWLEFLRTVAGVFVGAGLAFYSNLKLQERARRREEIAAGNSAMATLVRQYNSFLNVERSIREEIERRDALAPGIPLWFVFRPIIHFLIEDLSFDFKSLVFIFEDGNIETFQQLHMAEAVHREIMGYVRRLNEGSTRKQDKFEQAGFGEEDSKMTPAQARAIAGLRLTMELELVIEELQLRCAQDGPTYLNAAAELHRALSRRFGPGVRLIRLAGPA